MAIFFFGSILLLCMLSHDKHEFCTSIQFCVTSLIAHDQSWKISNLAFCSHYSINEASLLHLYHTGDDLCEQVYKTRLRQGGIMGRFSLNLSLWGSHQFLDAEESEKVQFNERKVVYLPTPFILSLYLSYLWPDCMP